MELIRDVAVIRSRVCITLDSNEKYYLSRKDVLEGGFAAGQEVDPEEFRRFVVLHQYRKALDRAVAMLALRPCSRGEIRQKLHSALFSDETIEMVLYKLEREKLLDDTDFSLQWAAYRAGHRYGSRRIYQELRYKGVSEEDAREALASLPEEEQLSQAVYLAEKALRRRNPAGLSPAEVQKLLAYLVRRGYDWDTARQALSRVLGQVPEDED